MNIVKVVFVCFLNFSVVLDVFAMKKEKQYGDPFTKYVFAGQVEAIFPKPKRCLSDSGLFYRLRVDKVLRGSGSFESVLVFAPNGSEFIEKSDKQVVFLMSVDSVIPERVKKCYPDLVLDDGERIGYVDYVSSEGVFKIIENGPAENLVYSALCSDEPHIALSDRLFDGKGYSFSVRSRNEANCFETLGFLDDLMELAVGSFTNISIKSNVSTREEAVGAINKL